MVDRKVYDLAPTCARTLASMFQGDPYEPSQEYVELMQCYYRLLRDYEGRIVLVEGYQLTDETIASRARLCAARLAADYVQGRIVKRPEFDALIRCFS